MSSSNNPKWDYYPHVWKTESAYLTWLRGQIRQIWNSCPQKKEFLRKQRVRKPKYDAQGQPIKFKNGKIKEFNAYVCNYCRKVCYESEKINGKKCFAVDHIQGNHTLTKFEHVTSFMDAMVRVREEDLQILCKSCHDNKTYSEKQGMTLDEAEIQKEAIKILNLKMDKQFFLDRSLPVPSNAKLRREEIVKILTTEK